MASEMLVPPIEGSSRLTFGPEDEKLHLRYFSSNGSSTGLFLKPKMQVLEHGTFMGSNCSLLGTRDLNWTKLVWKTYRVGRDGKYNYSASLPRRTMTKIKHELLLTTFWLEDDIIDQPDSNLTPLLLCLRICNGPNFYGSTQDGALIRIN